LKSKKDLFARCLAEKLLTYALGRGVEYYDKRPLDAIEAALAKDEYKFSTLVIGIVRASRFGCGAGRMVGNKSCWVDYLIFRRSTCPVAPLSVLMGDGAYPDHILDFPEK